MIVKSSQNISIPAATNVSFNNVNLTCNCDCITSVDTNGVLIPDGGIYEVNVTASGAATDSTGGTITLQLALDGAPIPYALTSAASAGTADIESLCISTLVRVPCGTCGCCGGHRLTVINSGIAALYSNITISVKAGDCDA